MTLSLPANPKVKAAYLEWRKWWRHRYAQRTHELRYLRKLIRDPARQLDAAHGQWQFKREQIRITQRAAIDKLVGMKLRAMLSYELSSGSSKLERLPLKQKVAGARPARSANLEQRDDHSGESAMIAHVGSRSA